MPDLKISQLPVATTPLAGTELVPIVQGGTTDQTTVQAIMTSTVPSGTANGVLYLNGSKVATSGSALTFDGSKLTVSATSGETGLLTATGVSNYLSIKSDTGGTTIWNGIGTDTGVAWVGSVSNHSVSFRQNNAEQMRLTSTGLGIGTSSPATKLHVVGTATFGDGTNGQIRLTSSSSLNYFDSLDNAASAWQTLTQRATVFDWFTAASGTPSTGMRLDSSGNLGLGVTPSFRFHTASSAFQDNVVGIQQGTGQTSGNQNRIQFLDQNGTTAEINAYGSSYGTGYNLGLFIGSNYLNTVALGGTFNYSQDGFASRYRQVNSQHIWDTAPSGTAGDPISFTQAMTLDASGHLLVGTTSILTAFSGAAVTAAGITGMVAQSSVVGNEAGAFWNTSTAGDNVFVIFGTEATYTGRGSITYNRAGGLVAYNTTSDYRAKDIIGPVQNPGATIDALKVYEGKMKGATQSRPMLIAHEAQAHAPYAVSGVKDEVNEDGTPKLQQMDVSSLVPLLLAEIQSLRARVAALEAQP